MLIKIYFYLVLLNLYLFAQQLQPIPTPEGTKFFFKSNYNFVVNSISIVGSFNNWNKKSNFMNYDYENKIWYGIVKLKIGQEYHYKFVINDSIWITDPYAPNVTEDEWQNGIIIPQKDGIPFVKNIFPQNNKRLTSFQQIKIELRSNEAKIDKNSIELFFDQKKIKFTFDENISELTAEIDSKISDGEHKIHLIFADLNGNINKDFYCSFFLDRFIKEISTPKFFDSSIVYEIFIRKFFDCNNDGKGDFIGLSKNIFYLKKELGINTIWLMPFTLSATEHGYNVIDFFNIENDYGNKNDFFNFLKEAKKLNIKIIMDFVINHIDSSHPYFLDAYKNLNSKYSNWFQFTNNENSDWNHFGVERRMPKLNFENMEVQKYFLKVAKYWIDPNNDGKFDDGIDGFRCDAAKEIPHQFWNKFRKEIKKIRNDFLLLGEVWDNANFMIPFFKEEFDMMFDYPLYYALEKYFKNNDISAIHKTMEEKINIYPKGFQFITFLSNHDNDRAKSKFENDIDKLKQAILLIFTLPGTPMIYYGDEIGMEGFYSKHSNRNFFNWDELSIQKKDEFSFYYFYKNIISLRRDYPAMYERNDAKSKSLFFLNDVDKKLLAYIRTNNKESFLILINNSEQEIYDCNLLITDFQFNKKIEPLPVIKHNMLSDKMGKLVITTFEMKDKNLQINNLYLDKGGFIVYKLY